MVKRVCWLGLVRGICPPLGWNRAWLGLLRTRGERLDPGQCDRLARLFAEHPALAAMGVELLTEDQYRELPQLGNFDTKSSSWVRAPAEIRKLGGGLFGDRRYGRVFVYHNGAQSYYSGRGFRASLRV